MPTRDLLSFDFVVCRRGRSATGNMPSKPPSPASGALRRLLCGARPAPPVRHPAHPGQLDCATSSEATCADHSQRGAAPGRQCATASPHSSNRRRARRSRAGSRPAPVPRRISSARRRSVRSLRVQLARAAASASRGARLADAPQIWQSSWISGPGRAPVASSLHHPVARAPR